MVAMLIFAQRESEATSAAESCDKSNG